MYFKDNLTSFNTNYIECVENAKILIQKKVQSIFNEPNTSFAHSTYSDDAHVSESPRRNILPTIHRNTLPTQLLTSPHSSHQSHPRHMNQSNTSIHSETDQEQATLNSKMPSGALFIKKYTD